MRGMSADALGHLGDECGRQPGRAPEEEQRPAPGDETERHFETTRPIDALSSRIRGGPLVHRPDERLAIALVTGQPVGLAESDEPLVAIQLPYDLAVSHDGAVERIQLTPVNERRAPSRDWIELPVDGLSEGEGAVAQEVESPSADFSGGLD